MNTLTLNNVTSVDVLINQYIFDCIDGEGYGVELSNNVEKLKFLAATFTSEYWKHQKQYYRFNRAKALAGWFVGLPSSFNVDYENYRILELGKSWGICGNSEIEEDIFIEGWFNMIARYTLNLLHTYDVKFN